MKRKTGLILDERFRHHDPPEAVPERPERISRIHRALVETGLMAGLVSVPPVPAGKADILGIHTPEYLSRIEATAGRPGVALTQDTVTSSGSYETALLAAGGAMAAVAAVLERRVDNAFALVRPPGHHAEKSRAMGYCLFNNVAIAAQFARRAFGIRRVLIVDWDVHHGNGTQHAFEADPDVCFFSMHQFPHFPGTGAFTDIGRGRGEGYTLNVPLPKGYGDGEYAAILSQLLPPVAFGFEPQLILVSAGFDTHGLDIMGGMRMTTEGFGALTRCLMEIADSVCGGRLVAVLEGGYHLGTIGSCVASVLSELSETAHTPVAPWIERADRKKVRHAVSRFCHVHRPYWKSLEAA